jgi:N-acetylglucosamine-6-sulfatase
MKVLHSSIVAWATILLALALGCNEPVRRPNFIVVMTDDQRWDEVEYMPSVVARLAGEGVTFANSFVATPLCCPARASFLSGLYTHHHGIDRLGGAPLLDTRYTIAVWLAQAGYTNALIGKYLNDNGKVRNPPPGWNRWRTFADFFTSFQGRYAYFGYLMNHDGRYVQYGGEPHEYSTDVLREMAIEFIRENAERPFFLFFAPFAPHAPAVPAPRHVGAFAGLEHPRAPGPREADLSGKPGYVRHAQESIGSNSPENLALYDAQVAAKRIGMLESLLAVDEAVAALLDLLDELGLADDTLVVFTSDNGEMEDEHWLVGKTVPYEESIRVPLLIRYPRVVPVARVQEQLVVNIDLAPTLLELAGAPIPERIDGVSLVPLLEDPDAGFREDFLIEFLRPALDRPPYVGVRSQRWKYIRNDSDPVFEELYDLAADPRELDNRLVSAPDDPEVRTAAEHLRGRVADLRPVEPERRRPPGRRN